MTLSEMAVQTDVFMSSQSSHHNIFNILILTLLKCRIGDPDFKYYCFETNLLKESSCTFIDSSCSEYFG